MTDVPLSIARPTGGLVPSLERAGVAGIEFAAATLLLVEITILFAGTVARYAFHRPLVWTDELNAILFLWLGSLGAVLAFHRGEHMGMKTFVAMLPEGAQAWLRAAGDAVVILFLALLLAPAIDHVVTEADVSSPTLDISGFWRASAMPAGIFLMLVSALLRLRFFPLRPTILCLVAAGLSVAGLVFAQPALVEWGQANLAIFFLLGVPALVFAGVPIAFAFGVATFAYLAFATYVPPSILVARIDAGMSQLLLLAIPTFIFLGALIEMTGMAARLVGLLANLLGHVRGGLHYALVVAMYLVSGISGSKAADMASIAPALFPEMEKIGHDRNAMAALLAATGAQTETVPPSLILIAVGSVSGLSIANLFTAGLAPAALLGALLCCLVFAQTRAEAPASKLRPSSRVLSQSLLWAAPALVLPFLIRAAVVGGVATATEVSTFGIFYAVAVGLLIYRQFHWRRIFPMLTAAATLSGAILFVTGAATAMAWAIAQSGFSQALAQAIGGAPGGVVTFMALSIVLFAALGSVLEGLPAIVLVGPLMFPIARGLGVNEIHYAIVAILAMSLGLFTPPFGVGFYITCAIGGAEPSRAMRPLWPYLAALLVGVVVIASFPSISIGLLK